MALFQRYSRNGRPRLQSFTAEAKTWQEMLAVCEKHFSEDSEVERIHVSSLVATFNCDRNLKTVLTTGKYIKVADYFETLSQLEKEEAEALEELQRVVTGNCKDFIVSICGFLGCNNNPQNIFYVEGCGERAQLCCNGRTLNLAQAMIAVQLLQLAQTPAYVEAYKKWHDKQQAFYHWRAIRRG